MALWSCLGFACCLVVGFGLRVSLGCLRLVPFVPAGAFGGDRLLKIYNRGAVHKSPRSLARGLAARFLACRPCLPSGPPQSAAGGVQPSLGLKTRRLHVGGPDCSYAGPRVVPARLWPATRSWVLLLALFVVPARFAPVSSGARPCMPCWCPRGFRALWEAPFCTRPCARALGPSLGSQVQRVGPKVFGQASPCWPLAFRPA